MFSDSFFARQQVTYLNGSMVVGPITIWIEIFICFNLRWWYGVKLFCWYQLGFHIFALFSTFDNLLKILLGHFSLIHFRYLLYLMYYFLILLFISSALLLDIF